MAGIGHSFDNTIRNGGGFNAGYANTLQAVEAVQHIHHIDNRFVRQIKGANIDPGQDNFSVAIGRQCFGLCTEVGPVAGTTAAPGEGIMQKEHIKSQPS